MGTSRKITERQSADAKTALEARVKVLQSEGLNAEQFARDPIWRKLDAKARQVNGRLRQIAALESQNAELLKLKAEKAAKKAAEKSSKPEKKPAESKPAKDKSTKGTAKPPKAKPEKAEKKE